MESATTLSWSLLLLFWSTVLLGTVNSYPSFQERIPNGNNVPHPCKANYRWQGVGHTNPNGGGERNVFGLDFDAQGYQWTTQLCAMDSDGDGMTNGEELGDPSCVWTVGQIPLRTKNITHPGVCEPIDSEKCKGKTDFVSCELEQFEKCDRINQPEVKTLNLTFPATPVPSQETTYICMTFDLPTDQDYHLIGMEPIIANRNVMHHIIAFGCIDDSEEPIESPTVCGMAASTEGSCRDIIASWTVGAVGRCLADNTGFRFGTTSYKRVKMQMHWNNPDLVEDYQDSSGLRLYYQPASPTVNDLAMLVVGQMQLTIPPGQASVIQTGVCPASCSSFLITKPAYVVRGLSHMHYLGQSQRVELFRNGAKITDLIYDERYSYDSPTAHYHEPPIELRPGDEIKTTCEFNSLSSNRYVYFGDGTQDEMCLGFLTLYPADALRPVKACIQIGPLSVCDLLSGRPVDGCDWKTFTDLTHPTTQELVDRLDSDCNLDGFCRPECKEIHDELAAHPCMQGEMKTFIVGRLEQAEEGVAFLGRFHSCSNQGDQTSQTCTKEMCGCGDATVATTRAPRLTTTTATTTRKSIVLTTTASTTTSTSTTTAKTGSSQGGTNSGTDPYNKEGSCTTYPCLIFEDEFDNLDTKFWEHEITAGGGGNWEFQYYINNRSNSYVRDGKLFIKPTLTTDRFGQGFLESGNLNLWGGGPADTCTGNSFYGCERQGFPGQVVNPIQSARVRSSRFFNFKYGRLEVEAKMPTGDWLWPAIWLLPRYNAYGAWPASGEIDLVECRGNINYKDENGKPAGVDSMGSTLHFGPFVEANQWPRAHANITASSGTFGDSFHKYRLDWDENSIRFSVDEQEILKVDPGAGGFWDFGGFEEAGEGNWDNPWAAGTRMAPFDQEFYIVMNVAVGGVGYFKEKYVNVAYPKPWNDTAGHAATDFWNARDKWLPTWKLEEDNGEGASMQVKYVRVWKMGPTP